MMLSRQNAQRCKYGLQNIDLSLYTSLHWSQWPSPSILEQRSMQGPLHVS